MKSYLLKLPPAKMDRYKADARKKGRNFREHIEECLEAQTTNVIREEPPVFPDKVTVLPIPKPFPGKQIKTDFKS